MLINEGSDLAYLNCDQHTLNDNKAHETATYVAKYIHAESRDWSETNLQLCSVLVSFNWSGTLKWFIQEVKEILPMTHFNDT